jgi:hypothetical protein
MILLLPPVGGFFTTFSGLLTMFRMRLLRLFVIASITKNSAQLLAASLPCLGLEGACGFCGFFLAIFTKKSTPIKKLYSANPFFHKKSRKILLMHFEITHFITF